MILYHFLCGGVFMFSIQAEKNLRKTVVLYSFEKVAAHLRLLNSRL